MTHYENQQVAVTQPALAATHPEIARFMMRNETLHQDRDRSLSSLIPPPGPGDTTGTVHGTCHMDVCAPARR